jgi:hypothetical protein
VLRVVLNMLAPVFLLSVLIWLFRSYGNPAELYILTLTADLQDYSKTANTQDLYLWYVHGLLHIMMLIYAALLTMQYAGGFGIGRRRFLIILFALGCLGRFALPALIDPGYYDPKADHTLMVYFLPTTHLATLALGALIAISSDVRERLHLIPLIAVYATLSGWLFGWSQLLFLGGGSLLLICLPRISLPRFAAPVVFALAGASLWIYMTHMMVQDVVQRLAPVLLPVGGIALALAVGILMWTAWARGWAWVGGRILSRPASVAADAAV